VCNRISVFLVFVMCFSVGGLFKYNVVGLVV